MTINPKDYDLDELRKMARKRGATGPVGDDEDGAADPAPSAEANPTAEPDVEWGPLDDRSGGGADDAFRARLYRELMPLSAGAADLDKPYLSTLPETHAAEFLIFEWLEFLLQHGGFRAAQDALNYYESIEWITEDVSSDLRDYLLGIDEQTSTDTADLDTDDHLLSLVYIAKITSMM